jgi:predicted DCC family thiol-disulfide oxidoreductase YuxK
MKSYWRSAQKLYRGCGVPARGNERIVVFDGVCNLCSGWVRFVLRHDVRGRLRFAPLQSSTGRELLVRNGVDPADAQTFLLVDGDTVYTRSDAALEIVKDLGAWRWLGVFGILPRGLRDWVYSSIARNRYRWFGKREACFVPTAEQRARFIDSPGRSR